VIHIFINILENALPLKHKNLPDEMRGMPGVGSIWTWTALDAVIVSWRLGARDAANAHPFMSDGGPAARE
jgi:hypothetical protein